ncbi:hypothetical protein J6590_078889 [Homalodisca vitripennis]|nr:hypothetical protein J6590_078889 [Homalodisca vitripennis]
MVKESQLTCGVVYPVYVVCQHHHSLYYLRQYFRIAAHLYFVYPVYVVCQHHHSLHYLRGYFRIADHLLCCLSCVRRVPTPPLSLLPPRILQDRSSSVVLSILCTSCANTTTLSITSADTSGSQLICCVVYPVIAAHLLCCLSCARRVPTPPLSLLPPRILQDRSSSVVLSILCTSCANTTTLSITSADTSGSQLICCVVYPVHVVCQHHHSLYYLRGYFRIAAHLLCCLSCVRRVLTPPHSLLPPRILQDRSSSVVLSILCTSCDNTTTLSITSADTSGSQLICCIVYPVYIVCQHHYSLYYLRGYFRIAAHLWCCLSCARRVPTPPLSILPPRILQDRSSSVVLSILCKSCANTTTLSNTSANTPVSQLTCGVVYPVYVECQHHHSLYYLRGYFRIAAHLLCCLSCVHRVPTPLLSLLPPPILQDFSSPVVLSNLCPSCANTTILSFTSTNTPGSQLTCGVVYPVYIVCQYG